MDKCREEFESWYKNFSGCDVINFDELGTTFVGEYKRDNNWLQNTTLLYSWQAWKASRESVKAIKLPEVFPISSASSSAKAIKEYKNAIT